MTGQELKQALEKQGLDHNWLARQLKVSPDTVLGWLRSKQLSRTVEIAVKTILN